MNKIVIKPYDVVAKTDLPEVSIDKFPHQGDPVEIKGELYFVCELNPHSQQDPNVIGVIPLVVRNPLQVRDIKEYIECLTIAHRKVLFKNEEEICSFDNCDEMIIS